MERKNQEEGEGELPWEKKKRICRRENDGRHGLRAKRTAQRAAQLG